MLRSGKSWGKGRKSDGAVRGARDFGLGSKTYANVLSEGSGMIISAKIIRSPRKLRGCNTCHRAMHEAQVRLYGAAHESDPPYVIYECISCAWESPDVVKALNKNSKEKGHNTKKRIKG